MEKTKEQLVEQIEKYGQDDSELYEGLTKLEVAEAHIRYLTKKLDVAHDALEEIYLATTNSDVGRAEEFIHQASGAALVELSVRNWKK